MSTLMHPTGPQAPSVYWVRRILVLLVLVAILLGVRWLLTGRGGSGGSGTPEAGPTAAPTSSASRTASPTASASASASPKPSGTTASPTGPTPCTREQLSVTASTDAASYPVGSTPHLRMKIENTSSTPCTRDIGATQNTLLITSGSARVWSSDDCSPAGSSQVVTMAPGQSYSVAVTWLGKLSQKGCPPNQPSATKGTYKLTGRNGDITSAPAVFALT